MYINTKYWMDIKGEAHKVSDFFLNMPLERHFLKKHFSVRKLSKFRILM